MSDHPPPRLWAYFGTYNDGGPGVYRSPFDPATGRLGPAEPAADLANPTWLTADPAGAMLYAVSEVADGRAVGFAVDPHTGSLAKSTEAPTGGADPCHAALTSGHLAVANYTGGSTAFLPVAADGSLGPPAVFPHRGSGPNPDRQASPFAHGLAEFNGVVYCADLGADRVFAYRLAGGRFEESPADGFAAPAGSGPRHLAVLGGVAYVCGELDLTVSAVRLAGPGGPRVDQTLPTLPADRHAARSPLVGADGREYSAAEVAVHPSGRFVYVSNRGYDTLAVFAVSPSDGLLTAVGHVPVGPARTPRSFALDPTGHWLLAAGQDGDAVAVFAVDPGTGMPIPAGGVVAVPKPVCVAVVPRR